MYGRAANNRLSKSAFESRVAGLLMAMFASTATIYVASRLLQDVESKASLVKELDKSKSQKRSALSVDDTLKITTCREQKERLLALEKDLAVARQEGFVSRYLLENDTIAKRSKKRHLAVIGIIMAFDRKKNRDAIRKAWMPTGAALKKLEDEKGIVVRFVIGRSASRGEILDGKIDSENRQTNDFIILNGQVESHKERSEKIKSFFVHAVENWDAEFYTKVNDDVYVNIDALGAALCFHLDKPRAFIGCMKSGEVFSQPSHKWYEPDWWKLGDGKWYFRHAASDIYAISRALAHFLSINRFTLRTYAHDDISAGA